MKQARAELDRLVAHGPPAAREARDDWRTWVTHAYLGLGMIRSAEEMATRIGLTVRRDVLRQYAASARGDRPAAMVQAQAFGRTVPSLMLAARAGAVAEGRSAVADWTSTSSSTAEKAVLGELARLEGRTAEAIPLLEEALSAGSHTLFLEQMFLLATESLAMAWLAQGETSRAVQVLDEAVRTEPRAMRSDTMNRPKKSDRRQFSPVLTLITLLCLALTCTPPTVAAQAQYVDHSDDPAGCQPSTFDTPIGQMPSERVNRHGDLDPFASEEDA